MVKKLALGVAAVMLFVCGGVVQYKIFPYEAFRQAKNLIDGEDGAHDPDEYVGSPETKEIGLGDVA